MVTVRYWHIWERGRMLPLVFDASVVHFFGAKNVSCALFCAALFAPCSPYHSRFIGEDTHRGLDCFALHFEINLC